MNVHDFNRAARREEDETPAHVQNAQQVGAWALGFSVAAFMLGYFGSFGSPSASYWIGVGIVALGLWFCALCVWLQKQLAMFIVGGVTIGLFFANLTLFALIK